MSDALRLAVLMGRHRTLSGDKVWNWKGGRRVHLGYIKLKQPGHPRADKQGYVFEHVLVWEAANNQALPSDWVIHHLNGVRDDNRAENLAAMPRDEHDRLIAAFKNRILKLEAENAELLRGLKMTKVTNNGILVQQITYLRQVKPPTLEQYVYRRAVREKMAELKGQTGVTINPDSGKPIPVSALAAREALKGLTAEQILKEHPEWREDYEREKDLHPRR
jgi:hypothetical protein